MATKNTKATADAVKQDTNGIADTARDYVTRTAHAAKERADSAYENVGEFHKGVESTLTRIVTGYVSILDGFAQMSHENVNRAIATVEKTAAAKDYVEAAQLQVDFVRDTATANYEIARNAVEQVRETLSDGAKTISDRANAMWNASKKAA